MWLLRVYVAVTGVYVVVMGSMWRSLGGCHIDPVTATQTL